MRRIENPLTGATLRVDDLLFRLLRIGILLAIALTIILPLLYVLSVSFRLPAEYYGDPKWIPTDPVLRPWKDAIHLLSESLINSFFIALGTAALALIISVPGSYVFARKQFPGRKSAFYLTVFSLLFPFILLIVPITELWFDLGLFNTLPGMWIAYQVFATPFAIWVLRDFFNNLPKNLEEAAQVYGCTQFSAFVRVILPLAAPALLAVGFLTFLMGWNNFLFANMLTTGNGPQPAVVVLFRSTSGGERTFWARLMAETLIIGAPPTVLYMFARRHLTSSFSL